MPPPNYMVVSTFLGEGHNEYYVVDVFRGKLGYPELRRKIVSLAKQHNANTILIEDAASGSSVVQDLRADSKIGTVKPIAVKPIGSKHERAIIQSSKVENGQVLLPASAPWLESYIVELLGFPSVKHDDQVDALTQFLGWVTKRKRRRVSHVGGQLFVGESFFSPAPHR